MVIISVYNYTCLWRNGPNIPRRFRSTQWRILHSGTCTWLGTCTVKGTNLGRRSLREDKCEMFYLFDVAFLRLLRQIRHSPHCWQGLRTEHVQYTFLHGSIGLIVSNAPIARGTSDLDWPKSRSLSIAYVYIVGLLNISVVCLTLQSSH